MLLKMRSSKQRSKILMVFLVSLLLIPNLSMNSINLKAEETDENPESLKGVIDWIDFGNKESEKQHNFNGKNTSIITEALDEKARVATPLNPADKKGGDLTFKMKVDPEAQNYFTLKFWGDDASSYVNLIYINGEQIGYRRNGDYEAINKGAGETPLPNRFYYSTIMLPLEHTYGKEVVEITIGTHDFFNNVTSDSRGYYKAYTHTQPYLDVSDENQGVKLSQNVDEIVRPDISENEKSDYIENYQKRQIDLFNQYHSQFSDDSTSDRLSIERYKEELRFYADTLNYDSSPAKTTEEKREVIYNIFEVIDNYVKEYYGDVRKIGTGGHQSDWGGYYANLGQVLYLIENHIFDEEILGEEEFNGFLEQSFDTGTEAGEFSLANEDWNGDELSRRDAWERTLKANFDFARSRLSYIFNQVMYTYEGAWKSSEGLRIIGSQYYEGKERSNRILLEALGIEPFLGEEVLVGPNGEELDLFHSLFYHDGSARYTDDYLQIVMKGLAKSELDESGSVVRRKPLGENYTTITEAGLTRENGYVANYGESTNYFPQYFYWTLNHEGDEELNKEILKITLKNLHARGLARYTSLTDDGERVMRMEQVIDERNPSFPGWHGYATRITEGKVMLYASLEKFMADNSEKYSDPEWDEYWGYAAEAVGFAQQQIADNQFFNHFNNIDIRRDLWATETYQYVTEERGNYDRFGNIMAGVVHPQTDFDYYSDEEIDQLNVDPDDYNQFAWVDLDSMFVSLRDNDTRIFGQLNHRNRGYVGNGKLHVLNEDHDNIVQIATNAKFKYNDYYLRLNNIDVDFMSDQLIDPNDATQALAGEVAPITYQPGVGQVNRQNFEVDHAYSGYPDLLTARYGKYFFVFNTTRAEYGNKQSFDIELPADFNESTVLDLVTGENMEVHDGKVTISAKNAMVLKLTSDFEENSKPHHVDFTNVLAGNGYAGITWTTTAGADSYTIKRSTSESGEYEEIATGIEGNYFEDKTVENGSTYYYKIAAVNENGSGWDSYRTKLDLTEPVSDLKGNKNNSKKSWRDDRVGDITEGKASVKGDKITIQDGDGNGFGTGDDYKVLEREIHDSFHFVNKVVSGNSSISGKIENHNGDVTGLMMRDQLDSNTRYIYFGADSDGNLVLQNRTRNSQHQWNDEVASPLNAELEGYLVDDYPYLKLERDADKHMFYAYVSQDGENWENVAEIFTPFPYAIYTGVTASDNGRFNEVNVAENNADILIPRIKQVEDHVTLYWNKPKDAVSFNVYRTYDEKASRKDPVFKEGTMTLKEDSSWKEVLSQTTGTAFEEDRLRIGSVYFKVVANYADGSFGSFSETASAYADSIGELIGKAETMSPEPYTKGSYYLFKEELKRIKEVVETAKFDEVQLVDDLYNIYDLLVPKEEILLKKIEIGPSMVVASTEAWGGNGTAEENAWFAFDGDLQTFPDTLERISWVDIDLGEASQSVIDTIKYYPRHDHIGRINGLVIQGSNDKENWTELYEIGSVSEAKWHSNSINDSGSYRYFRLYDDHDGRVNVAEMEFYQLTNDKTLLQLLIERAESVDESKYDQESMAMLTEALTDAIAVNELEDIEQKQIDESAAALQVILEELEVIANGPILAPIGNKLIVAETNLSFKLKLNSRNNDSVQYRVEGLPEGAQFNEKNKKFSWTPERDQSGEYQVTFIVSDGENQSSQTIKIVVKGEPSLNVETGHEVTVGEALDLSIDASDPTGEELTYHVESLPENAEFNEKNSKITWIPDDYDVGTYEIIISVSNERFTVSETISITVKIPVEKYTKGSYYLFEKVIASIHEEMENTERERKEFSKEIEEAVNLLVSIEKLYQEIEVTEEMVIASHKSWDDTASKRENGWYAFDGNTSTATDNASNPGWVQIDFGDEIKRNITSVSFYPRQGYPERMEGSIIQGSNDGEKWTDLIRIGDVSSVQWHQEVIENNEAFRYIRYYSPRANTNVAELKFSELLVDKSLLEVLIDEAIAVDSSMYSEESYNNLQNIITSSEEVVTSEQVVQAEVDAAVEELQLAIDSLEER
ncbi:Tat pathway signal protein [Gracilibacillus salitolerans]|uniref:Tat pathway signal protein n=2 Tax=Gracilibacillus salitolerans TaxID=2663022 RepID=A0A5Q2TJ77_9BACI|nr:Tat pathway signal protein [Gracilibacillus salitolerans]